MSSKPLEFSCTGINNFVNQWQKLIDVQRFWPIKTLFQLINSGIKIYFKIGHYFPDNLIYRDQQNETEILDKVDSMRVAHPNEIDFFLQISRCERILFQEYKSITSPPGKGTDRHLNRSKVLLIEGHC